MPPHQFKRRLGIISLGNKLWISELTSIFFAVTLLVSLIIFTVIIIRNEYATYRLTGRIAAVKSDRIVLSHYLDELKDRVAITELLCIIAGKKLSPQVLYSLSDIIYRNSHKFGYDPLLLLAVIEVESVFSPEAKGRYRRGTHSGALGLMQLKPATAREVAKQLDMDSVSRDDLFKPEINIALGVAYLTRMITAFKSFKLGLLAYNQGPAHIREQLSRNKPLSVKYYRKVLRAYYRLRNKAVRLSTEAADRPLCQ
jgi:hypothetical protein